MDYLPKKVYPKLENGKICWFFFLPNTCGVGGRFMDPSLAFFADFVVSDRRMLTACNNQNVFERVVARFFFRLERLGDEAKRNENKQTQNSFGSISSNYIGNVSICNQTD